MGGAWAGSALVVAALCAIAPARAQASGALTLVCPGADLQMPAPRMLRGGMKMTDRVGRIGATSKPEKRPAQINVIVEGATARIWVSQGILPAMTRKSADGWYALRDVEVDAAAIQGTAPFGVLGRTGLRIDRTNGKASLGSFQGVCHPAMLGPNVTQF